MELVLFAYLFNCRKTRKTQRNLHLIIRLKQLTTDKRSWFIFQHRKCFTEKELVYFTDILEDNHVCNHLHVIIS